MLYNRNWIGSSGKGNLLEEEAQLSVNTSKFSSGGTVQFHTFPALTFLLQYPLRVVFKVEKQDKL